MQLIIELEPGSEVHEILNGLCPVGSGINDINLNILAIFHLEADYGADADGNRGEGRVYVEDIGIIATLIKDDGVVTLNIVDRLNSKERDTLEDFCCAKVWEEYDRRGEV